MHLNDLKKLKPAELQKLAQEFNIEGSAALKRQDLLFAILTAQADASGTIYGEGVLECLPDGFGF